jgi:hypothetical protein
MITDDRCKFWLIGHRSAISSRRGRCVWESIPVYMNNAFKPVDAGFAVARHHDIMSHLDGRFFAEAIHGDRRTCARSSPCMRLARPSRTRKAKGLCHVPRISASSAHSVRSYGHGLSIRLVGAFSDDDGTSACGHKLPPFGPSPESIPSTMRS